MIRSIYQHLLPLCVRTALGQCRNRLRQWQWQAARKMPFNMYWRGMRRACKTGYTEGKRRELARILQEKGTLTVAFQVTCMAKWKADSLLAAMQRHPTFKPLVWLVPYLGKSPQEIEREWNRCASFFREQGTKIVKYGRVEDFPAEWRPDLIFPSEPYNTGVYDAPYNRGLLDRLFCFLPYGFTSTDSALNYNQVINNGAVFAFLENEVSYRTACRLMDNGGRNAVCTGQAMADMFLFPPRPHPQAWKDCAPGLKRVIWAPHWSITDDSSWLRFGTFLKTGETMLELARAHAGDIQFAFKPHPNLYSALCEHPQWGKDRTDEFYRTWREMPNSQLEDGEYAALFMQSDAMIHDCGSFIQEYLFADKPCMYLREGLGFQGYSDMAADCLNAYQIGITREEIEEFLQMVLRGEDPKAEVRRELRKKYLVPPHGQSAAQNIIDFLLMQAGSTTECGKAYDTHAGDNVKP